MGWNSYDTDESAKVEVKFIDKKGWTLLVVAIFKSRLEFYHTDLNPEDVEISRTFQNSKVYQSIYNINNLLAYNIFS